MTASTAPQLVAVVLDAEGRDELDGGQVRPQLHRRQVVLGAIKCSLQELDDDLVDDDVRVRQERLEQIHVRQVGQAQDPGGVLLRLLQNRVPHRVGNVGKVALAGGVDDVQEGLWKSMGSFSFKKSSPFCRVCHLSLKTIRVWEKPAHFLILLK